MDHFDLSLQKKPFCKAALDLNVCDLFQMTPTKTVSFKVVEICPLRLSSKWIFTAVFCHRLYKLETKEALRYLAFQAAFLDAECSCFWSSALCYRTKPVCYPSASGSLVQKPSLQGFQLSTAHSAVTWHWVSNSVNQMALHASCRGTGHLCDTFDSSGMPNSSTFPHLLPFLRISDAPVGPAISP